MLFAPKTRVKSISASRLRKLGGVVPFSSISQKRKSIRKRKPQSAHWNPVPGALDPRSRFEKGRTLLFGADMTALRLTVYRRSGGRCEAKRHVRDCPRVVSWHSAEMDHIKSKGLGGGWRNDTPENTRILSQPCHQKRTGNLQGRAK